MSHPFVIKTVEGTAPLSQKPNRQYIAVKQDQYYRNTTSLDPTNTNRNTRSLGPTNTNPYIDQEQQYRPVHAPVESVKTPNKYGYVNQNICLLILFVVVVGGLVFFMLSFGLTLNGSENEIQNDNDNAVRKQDERADDDEEEDDFGIYQEMKRQQPEETKKESECAVGKEANADNTCEREFYYPDAIDPSMFLEEVDPCDNFYMYSCGSFVLDERNMGEDSTFSYMYDKNVQTIEDIIQNAPITSKLETFYTTCLRDEMNPVNFEQGIIKTLISMVNNDLNSIDDLSKVMGQLWRYDILLPFSFTMELDPAHAKRAIPTFLRSGLSSDIDNVGSQMHKKEIETRLMYIYPNIKSTSEIDAVRDAEIIADIETRLSLQWTDSSNRKEESMSLLQYTQEMKEKRKDLISYQPLKEIMYPFNVDEFMKSFVGEYRYEVEHWHLDDREDVWVFTEKYLIALGHLLSQLPVETWKTYLLHAIVFSVVDPSPTVSPELYYTYHHGYDPEFSLPWKRPGRFVAYEELAWDRESRCAQVVAAFSPVMLDTFFVLATNIDQTMKNNVKQMAERIRDELSEYLRSRGSITAAQKVEKIEVMAGTPNSWPRDSAELTITTLSHIQNILNIRNYHQNIMINTMYPNKILSPDDLFDGPLYLVNAYYQHQLNTILINAGILTMPAYSNEYSLIAQTARLGVFIGHELTHSVDITGTFFDETGSYNPWMSSSEQQQYMNRAQCIIDLYNKETYYGNKHDGDATVNENIADIIGFRSAYNSLFTGSTNYTNNDKINFFKAYAQTWCTATTKQDELNYIETSVHSTPEMRVNNVVNQHPNFAPLFGCKTQQKKCNIF